MRPLKIVVLAIAGAVLAGVPLVAQSGAGSVVSVVMLSDIHLDPFHDPAKVAALNAAPVEGWAAVLYGAASATQAADFAMLQTACKGKGVDTPAALLQASLAAAQKVQPHPVFVTVSGDLMAHQFDCKFRTLLPKGTAADYSAFAAKTVAFVAQQVRLGFAGAPVYLALGNNDSGCKDYAEDSHSAYLAAVAQSFAGDVLSKQNADAVRKEFSAQGDYSVDLPRPFAHTRLLVMQDIFESKKYKTCNGQEDEEATAAQVKWLRGKLLAARMAHEKVWVMAHIPPGVDAYSTFTKARDVCGGQSPEMFLNSEALGATLAEFGDVIKLALFGHTHMDEMRIYGNGAVPGKVVPSITPVNGNNPAFTVAQVDAATAIVKDYEVVAAADAAGTAWSEQYRYATAYAMPDFSAASVGKLMAGFAADRTSVTAATQAYETHYFVGDPHISMNAKAAAMQLVWPAYACSMANARETEFRNCMCGAK